MRQGIPHRSALATLGLALWVAFSLMRCAHPVAPTGGPQDITPPAVTATEPPNYTVRFQENKIQLFFDEFIQLKDQAKEVFVSPPMKVKPELIVRGKSLVIQLKDELRENMTYVITFGSAIVDITENNPLKGFSYVFSTGDVIDSLFIAGKLLNAYDLKPVEDALFVIYSPGQDTIPDDSLFRKVQPLSAVRTASDGSFLMTNLPGGKYLAYALQDLNNNFYYDLPTEKIAFLDSLVTPESFEMPKDTADTMHIETRPMVQTIVPERPVTLYLFQEDDPEQRILSSSITPEGSITFAFRKPIREIEITPLNFPAEENWQVREYNRPRDTLYLWPLDYERDTFRLSVNIGDTIADTMTFIRKDDSGRATGRRKGAVKRSLEVKLSTRASTLLPGRHLNMSFSEPLANYDFSGIRLYTAEDTVQPEVALTGEIKRRATIRHEWEYGQRYLLYLPDSIMTGLSGAGNDSLNFVILTKSLEEYGTLIVNYILNPEEGPYVAELLNEKEAVVKRDTLTASQEVIYKYLEPGVYRIKMIFDINGNGSWDTGKLHKQLPEKVLYFGMDITIRPNWEMLEEWQPE